MIARPRARGAAISEWWQQWRGRRLTTVRARLTVLLGLAAVPVVVLAAVITWQNYQLVVDRALHEAVSVRTAEIGRDRATIEGLEQLLAALSTLSPLQSANRAACDAALGVVLPLQPARLVNLMTLTPDGRVRCSALPAPDPRPALPPEVRRRLGAGSEDGGLSLSPPDREPVSGELALIATYPLPASHGPGGTVAAALRLSALLGDSRKGGTLIWLYRADGRPWSAKGQPAGAEPSASLLPELLQPDAATVQGRARDRRIFAYAAMPLSPGLWLATGHPAQAALQEARAMLLERIVVLGVLLSAGLLAVALGADSGVVRPIKQLTGAVHGWRESGRFEPGDQATMPAELRSLTEDFAAATAALAVQEDQLRSALTRHGLLMQEIHHRVKNNLQIVASLLNLQASRIRSPQARAEFESARDRVRALATLHRHLYAEGELHTINMRHFLEELCGQLFQAMGEREGSRIRLLIEAPEIQISSDQAVPLALIVTEAVSNALKYAFPGGRHGQIAVRLTASDGAAELVIEDDGIGMPEGRRETETGTRDGIGLQLIRGFARQLGAGLDVAQEEGAGTRYRVRLALRPTAASELAEPVAAGPV